MISSTSTSSGSSSRIRACSPSEIRIISSASRGLAAIAPAGERALFRAINLVTSRMSQPSPNQCRMDTSNKAEQSTGFRYMACRIAASASAPLVSAVRSEPSTSAGSDS